MLNDTCKYKVLGTAEEAWRKPSVKLIARRKSGFLWNPSLGIVTIWCEIDDPANMSGFAVKAPGLDIDVCIHEGCTPELVKDIISTKCLNECNWALYAEYMTECKHGDRRTLKRLFKKPGWLWCDDAFDYGYDLEEALAAVGNHQTGN